MNKGLKALIMAAVIFNVGLLFGGCTVLEKGIQEYSKGKEECQLNPENVIQFTYRKNEYTILDTRSPEDKTGSWVGYIRKLAVTDDTGKILWQQDTEKIKFDTLTDMTDTEPGAAYMLSFLNVYLDKEDSGKLIVDVNGEQHEAVLSSDVMDKDKIYDYRKETAEAKNSFTVSPENCTQLLSGNKCYQITDEILGPDDVGKYLDIIPKTFVFDEDTKREISQDELGQIDWYGDGQSRQKRAQWSFGEVCEIKNTDPSKAVAVEVNYEYHIAVVK